APGRLAQMDRRGKEPRVLAGTVVVGGVRRLAGVHHRPHRSLVIGPMGAAFEIAGGKANAPEPRARRLDMPRPPAVGGTGARALAGSHKREGSAASLSTSGSASSGLIAERP